MLKIENLPQLKFQNKDLIYKDKTYNILRFYMVEPFLTIVTNELVFFIADRYSNSLKHEIGNYIFCDIGDRSYLVYYLAIQNIPMFDNISQINHYQKGYFNITQDIILD